MTIDATASTTAGGLIHIFFFAAPTTLYRQEILSRQVRSTWSAVLSGIPRPGPAFTGLTVDRHPADSLYATDTAFNIYIYPEDGGPGVPYSNTATGGYTAAAGLFYYPLSAPSAPCAGSPTFSQAALRWGLCVEPDAGAGGRHHHSGQWKCWTADGGRANQAQQRVALNALASTTVITEDAVASGGTSRALVAVIANLNLFPDGGAPDGGGSCGGGSMDGGIPTIPIIAPGPGALPGPTNSCNCSTAGSAPMLLALLLPLLVPRRRR